VDTAVSMSRGYRENLVDTQWDTRVDTGSARTVDYGGRQDRVECAPQEPHLSDGAVADRTGLLHDRSQDTGHDDVETDPGVDADSTPSQSGTSLSLRRAEPTSITQWFDAASAAATEAESRCICAG
jgi:hypothetical protein